MPVQDSTPHVALLVRHRWIGDPIHQLYRCIPGIPSLYRSYDPQCYGCGSIIPWSAIPGLARFCGVSEPRNRILAEHLGVTLDLRIAELAIEQARSAA